MTHRGASSARCEGGQMAVEVAIVAPVLLIVLVIIVDMLVFTGECARFDHMAPQRVLASTTMGGNAESAASDQAAAIQGSLEEEFARNGASVQVTCESANQMLSSMVVYRCELRFVPWPLPASSAPPILTHACAIAVDPYVPGELL